MRLTQNKSLWQILLLSLLILVLARFMVVGLAKVLFNTQSSDGDESAYLELGLSLREDGTLTDGTRPPLYPLLLTPAANRDWSYFTWAKLITLSVGALTVVVTFIIGRQLFNWPTGLLAAFLLAWNKEFHLRASTVYADTLLVLLFLVAWYFLIKSFEKTRYCVLAGFFVGLAYLTKSSVLLLLVVWAAVAVWHYRRRIFAQTQLLLVPLVFLVTTSPLLIYNWRHFGQPFYSFATTHVIWMDRWAESQVENLADLPTLTTYLQSHTAAEMAARLQEGISRLNPELALTLIPSRNFEPPWLGYLIGGGLLLALIWLTLFHRERLQTTFQQHQITILMFVLLAVPFYLFSAWYARVLIESRFLIPILGPFYILLSAAVVGVATELGRWANRRGRPIYAAYVVLVTGLIMWGVWWSVTAIQQDAWSLTVDPFVSDREANEAPQKLLAWLERDHPATLGPAKIIFGPSKSLPIWKFPSRFTLERIPVDINTWPKLASYLDKNAPAYIIIDSDTARRRRAAMGDYFTYFDEGIKFQRVPPGWMLAHLSNEPPHTWVVFSPETSPGIPAQGNIDNQIALIGYDLTPYFDVKERILRVTLYWQVLAQPQQDYTVFVHLTAPDGFVKAQHDQQPFDGLWPTSRWTTGDVLADRYEIVLDENVQPGEYLLLAGLYEAQTGQRLPLIGESRAPSPNAVLLGQVTGEQAQQ